MNTYFEECEELDVNFTDASSVPDNGSGGIYSEIIRWEWDLGNGVLQQIMYICKKLN